MIIFIIVSILLAMTVILLIYIIQKIYTKSTQFLYYNKEIKEVR